jgi:hypothetical protein
MTWLTFTRRGALWLILLAALHPHSVTASGGLNSPLAPSPNANDLSGKYEGRLDFPEQSMKGHSVLEIAGDVFNLRVVDGPSLSGKINVVTTHGYTAVFLRYEGGSVSLRARGRGAAFTLRSAPGESEKFVFCGCNCKKCKKDCKCCRPFR